MSNPILDSHIDFSGLVDLKRLRNIESRILFVLYFAEQKYGITEVSTDDLFDVLNQKLRIKTTYSAIGMAIRRSGNKISSVNKNGTSYHKIMIDGVNELSPLLEVKQPKKVSDAVIPNEVVNNEKEYFKKVVRQVNGCYQEGYYDACFVMVRRVIETLIIDVFENLKIEDEIKDSDGDYLPFSKLIDHTLGNNQIKLSKIAKRDLSSIKKFGDIAAHNRKLNLKKPDIDKYSDSIRVIVEELINHKS